ncbi:hypothetical protein ATANTOWER_019280 [Ataeniobius toweri]|uniref:Uncharacterized protein n=1 Tax=Ataeniobius toweri TaxID=208326 RepID=A0ABU7B9S6_9TELE|nr:hypothetical protein [Ataeniobius toweri]
MSVSAPYKYAIASVRSHRPAPLDLGQIRRIFQAIDIQRLPRAQEPQEIHRWDYRNHPREEQGRARGAAVTSPQAPQAAFYAQADPAMDPETQDPWTYHSPGRGPTEPGGPSPGKQPPEVSQHTPKHPAPDMGNHKYTSRQRHQQSAGSVAGKK